MRPYHLASIGVNETVFLISGWDPMTLQIGDYSWAASHEDKLGRVPKKLKEKIQ